MLVLIALLSALVLILAGTAVFLALRLHALKKAGEGEQPHAAQLDLGETARLERMEQMCMDIKRSLTHIGSTAPSEIPGLSIERIRLLCTDTLKEQINAVLRAGRSFVRERDEGDRTQFDEWAGQLASLREEVRQIEQALTSIFKTWSRSAAVSFDPYEQRLTAVSRRLDELRRDAQTLLYIAAEERRTGETLSVSERIRKAAASVRNPDVCTALNGLETLLRQHDDVLDRQVKARLESDYLQTLELVLGELRRAEQAGENTDAKVRLSLRVICVLSNIVSAGQQTQHEISERSLEAEVVAMERLAVLRGDDVQDRFDLQ